MTVHLEAPFRIDKWDVEQDPPAGEDSAPATGHVALAKSYSGDRLTGTATGHALTAQGPRGASYVAQERIVGRFDGREGSFVLEHRASMGEGYETVMHAVIVPGSGTGELTGISGTGKVEHELLTLDIDLPER